LSAVTISRVDGVLEAPNYMPVARPMHCSPSEEPAYTWVSFDRPVAPGIAVSSAAGRTIDLTACRSDRINQDRRRTRTEHWALALVCRRAGRRCSI